jgi:hypothetical protein
MTKLPVARSADIVVQELGKEVLVYDLKLHKAYNLNQTSSIVYKACDGRTTFADLNRKHKFTDDLIHLALDQLRESNLIETDNQFVSPFSEMSRRAAIRRVGLVSMIALPFITSLIAPKAVDAQSSTCPALSKEAPCICPPTTPLGDTCGVGTTNGGLQPCDEGCLCQSTGPCNTLFCQGKCI